MDLNVALCFFLNKMHHFSLCWELAVQVQLISSGLDKLPFGIKRHYVFYCERDSIWHPANLIKKTRSKEGGSDVLRGRTVVNDHDR